MPKDSYRCQSPDGTDRIVAAGSPTAAFDPSETNGYEREWLHLADVVTGGDVTRSSSDLIDDLSLTLDLAEAAGEWILNNAPIEQVV